MLTIAASLDDVLIALQSPTARVIAGGTDIYPAARDHSPSEDMIDISALNCLRGIKVEDRTIRIGALTRWSDIADASLPRALLALQHAARQVGGRHIQNAGTIAGNICNASPAADGVPPLLIVDANVELRSKNGMRSVPVADFISGNRQTARAPEELVTAITIPKPTDSAASAFEKLGSRSYLVISIAMVAALVRLDEAGRISEVRVAVGACSPVAKRLPDLEKHLVGIHPAALCVEPEFLSPLSPIDDSRATAEYRLHVTCELVRRAIEKAAHAHG